MKENFKTYESESNIQPLRKVNMGIKNVGKMLRMTSEGMYSNPIQTAVQEYISNARDSHTAVKKGLSSIQITAPSLASQILIIQDFGIGMSPDVVENVFAQFAGSLKEESDEFIGGKGLGCKVWFAVSQQFTVVSVHDGMEYEYLFKRDNSVMEYGSCLLMRENKTKKENGVTLYLPLDNETQIDPIKEAINKTVKYWYEQPTIINHDLPEFNKIFSSENYTLVEVGSAKTILTVGGVPYNTNNLSFKNDISEMFPRINIVLHLPIKGIVFPSTREAIMDNDGNKKIILDFAKKVKKHLTKTIKNKILPELSIEEKIEFICKSRFYKDSYSLNLINNIDLNFSFQTLYGEQKLINSEILKDGKKINLGNKVLSHGVHSTISFNADKVDRIYLFKSIILLDIEVNKIELNKGLRTVVPHNASLRQSNKEVVGSYIFKNSFFTEEEIIVLKNHFKVYKMSELDYKIPKRKKGEKSQVKRTRIEKTHFTSMSSTVEGNSFSKIKKGSVYLKLDFYRNLSAEDKNRFDYTVKCLKEENKKDYIVASSSLEKSLVKLGLLKVEEKDIIKDIKASKFFNTIKYRKLFNKITSSSYNRNLNKKNYDRVKVLASVEKTPYQTFIDAPSFKTLDSFSKFRGYGQSVFRSYIIFKEEFKEYEEKMKAFKKEKSNAFYVSYIKESLFNKPYSMSDKDYNTISNQFVELFKEKCG